LGEIRNSHILTRSYDFPLKQPTPKISYRKEQSGVKLQLFWNYISFRYSNMQNFVDFIEAKEKLLFS
jgi:hypothetical protein